jgi:two-component system OmpR family sensor kinase/two-component system sensor histidine kinase BaeS
MSYRRYYRTHRPSWWPENQPWPPQRGRHPHNPFFRRLGCFFGLFSLLGFIFFILLIAFILGNLETGQASNYLRWALPVGLVMLLSIVVIVTITVRMLRRISMPLDDMHAAATRLADGDYSVRVVEKGPPEVRSLARAFNNMAARLHQADEQRRTLLADTTHELLTPLTVVHGNLEGMLDGLYPANEDTLRGLLDEVVLLERLVEDLRTLALAESGALQLKKEPTDLMPYLRDTADGFQPQAESAGVSITVDAPADLPLVEIDPGRMHQVLANLLNNALRYSPAGGRIALRCERDDGKALISIQDDGPGIPETDLQKIFDRFYKSADSGGMGLGLAIAKHLVSAHGGSIWAENAPERGTIMHISLPLAT